MTPDTYTLLGLGVGAVILLWLVFSVLKKVIGFLLLIALLAAAWLLWTNPDMLHAVTTAVQNWIGSR